MAVGYPVENRPTSADGDAGFRGFDARNNPALLGDGLMQMAENVRMDRGVAAVRHGRKSLVGDFGADLPPLEFPFTLVDDVVLVSITRVGSVATVTLPAAHGWVAGRIVNLRNVPATNYNGNFPIVAVPTPESFTIVVTGAPPTPQTDGLVNGGPVLTEGVLTGDVVGGGLYRNKVNPGAPEYVVLLTETGSYQWRQGQAVTTRPFPAGEECLASDRPQLVQALDKLYLFRNPAEEGEWERIELTSLERLGNVVTATYAGHWAEAGQRWRISGTDQAAYAQEFEINSVTADTFSFAIGTGWDEEDLPASPATSSAGAIYAQRVKPPLYWDGTAAAWQLAPTGSHPAGPTYWRMQGNIRAACYVGSMLALAWDATTILLTDVLDADTIDPFAKSIRVNAGGNDFIVGMYAFNERDLLILCRYSLWKVHVVLTADGLSLDASSYVAELPIEIGCWARDSVAKYLHVVHFLSDDGIYGIDSTFSVAKLTAPGEDVADTITPILDALDADVAPLAFGVVQGKRYFLLHKREGEAGMNALLVHSFANGAWESLDRYEDLDAVALLTSRYDGRERLMAVGGEALLSLLDERTDGDDAADAEDVNDIEAPLTLRRYFGKDHMPKRILRARAMATRAAEGGRVQVTTRLIDPEVEIAHAAEVNDSDAADTKVIACAVRTRAHAVEFVVTLTKPGTALRGFSAVAASLAPAARTRTEG